MNDGASAVIVSSRKRADELGLKPLASIVGYASVGVEPAYMGIGPVEATRLVLKNTGLAVNDIDIVETK